MPLGPGRRAMCLPPRSILTTTAGGASALGGVSDRPKTRNAQPCRFTSMCFSRVRTWPRPRWTRWRKTPPTSSPTIGGKVVKTETWGLRTLAYRIAKNRKAPLCDARHRRARAGRRRARAPDPDQRGRDPLHDRPGRRARAGPVGDDAPQRTRAQRGDRGDRDRGDRGGRDRDRGDRGDRAPRPDFADA